MTSWPRGMGGRRDEGTEGQRDKGAAGRGGRRDEGTKGRRDKGAAGMASLHFVPLSLCPFVPSPSPPSNNPASSSFNSSTSHNASRRVIPNDPNASASARMRNDATGSRVVRCNCAMEIKHFHFARASAICCACVSRNPLMRRNPNRNTGPPAPHVIFALCPFIPPSVPSAHLSLCPSVPSSLCPSTSLSLCPFVPSSLCPSVPSSLPPSNVQSHWLRFTSTGSTSTPCSLASRTICAGI